MSDEMRVRFPAGARVLWTGSSPRPFSQNVNAPAKVQGWQRDSLTRGHLVFYVSLDGGPSHATAGDSQLRYPCPQCGEPLEWRGPFDGRAASTGVTGGHEGFGETLMCDAGHWHAFIQLGVIPPERILTVIDL
jgi:hypothetical protein